MIIKFRLPVNLDIVGESPEYLVFSTSFKHNGQDIKASGDYGETIGLDTPFMGNRYHREIKNLIFFIKLNESSKQGKNILNLLSAKEPQYELIEFVSSVINRVLRGIRNFGYALDIHEIKPKKEDTEHLYRYLDIRISESGKEYNQISKKPKDLKEHASYFAYLSGRRPSIFASRIPEIIEAIHEKIEVVPERELNVNASEYLNKSNYRMALVEAIASLDIIISKYVRTYLSSQHSGNNIPLKRINDFLSPEFQLFQRLFTLFYIMPIGNCFQSIDKNAIFKANEWRNNIVHKNGRLPQNIKDEDLQKAITNVVNLVLILIDECNQIEIFPIIKDIIDCVKTKYEIPILNIRKHELHNIFITIHFQDKEIPKKEILEDIIEEISVKLADLDKKFVRDKHLTVFILKFPNTIIKWQ